MRYGAAVVALAALAGCAGASSKHGGGGGGPIASAFDPNPPGCMSLFNRTLATRLPTGWRMTSDQTELAVFTLDGEPRVTVTARAAWTPCEQHVKQSSMAPAFFSSDWLTGEVNTTPEKITSRSCTRVSDDGHRAAAMDGHLIVDVEGHASLERDPRITAMTSALHWEGRNASSCTTPAQCVMLPGTSRQLAVPAGWTMTPDPTFAEVARFALVGRPDVVVATSPTGTSTCAGIVLEAGMQEKLRPAYTGEAYQRTWEVEQHGRPALVSCTDGDGGAYRVLVQLADDELARSYRLRALTDAIAFAAYNQPCDEARSRMKI